MRPFYADSLGFFSLPGKKPEIDRDILLDLVHVTVAPPWVRTTEEVLQEREKAFSSIIDSKKEDIVFLLESEIQDRDFFPGVGPLRIVQGIQHAPEDVDVGILKDAGISIMGIAYAKENRFGSGFANPEVRLTKAGEGLVRDCALERMIIDLSHAGHATARDVLALVENEERKVPVIASHGGCHAVYPHLRNLPDDVLRGIAERGGVVGIYTLTFGLHAERDDLGPFLDHVAHALDVCGEDAVTIGSDGTYKRYQEEELRTHYNALAPKLGSGDVFKSRFPTDPAELNAPRRMDVIAEKLYGRFPTSVADKVLGLNFLRFLRENL